MSSVDAPLPRSHDFDLDPDSFHSSTWLNAVLSHTQTTQNAITLNQLLDATNDAVREAHSTLDQSLKSALSAIPWVVRETERVRQRATALRTSVDGVGERVAGVETSVVSSVKTIADADTVVRRVQDTAQLLSTAVTVDTLLDRLSSLLASSAADGADLVQAADLVSQLRTSLLPLRQISEFNSRVTQLEGADASLEQLAKPQLQRALEQRNTSAARNARIVYDHAGRENAFRTQYGSLRAAEVRSLWSRAWSVLLEDRDEDNDSVSSRILEANLCAPKSDSALQTFYDKLEEMLVAERTWLLEAFPDLCDIVLPELVSASMGGLSPPLVVKAGDSADFNLYSVALRSIRSCGRIGRTFLPSVMDNVVEVEGGEEEISDVGDEVMLAIQDAISSLLLPYRKFWDNFSLISVQSARRLARSIKLGALDSVSPSAQREGGSDVRRPILGLIAKDVDVLSKDALTLLDGTLTILIERTCGIGIDVMKRTSGAIASELSERIIAVLRMSSSAQSTDEWTNISDVLRLLTSTSILKRTWDGKKESLFAIAVGTATPVLEVASVVQVSRKKRIQQFLTQAETSPAEAGIVWELVRDSGLTRRTVSEFEMLESANDFGNLIDVVHRLVYESMFNGVQDRFNAFNGEDFWNVDGDDETLSSVSSSPLAYATEVADYLMTIPQQLEPFIPDEEDARFAMPKSPYAFCKRSANVDDELSFAGMWISVLTIATMEFYVEKIGSLSRLSEGGTRQLATDVDYICNVIASLGVSPSPEMTLICKLLEAKSERSSFLQAMEGYTTIDHKKLARRIAALRGISVPL
ncbi:Golgi complex component 7 (COG7) [Gracilaria domingensis]|nr:Golgi complex component 7 (COG7) [Gracilaria domingensis]